MGTTSNTWLHWLAAIVFVATAASTARARGPSQPFSEDEPHGPRGAEPDSGERVPKQRNSPSEARNPADESRIFRLGTADMLRSADASPREVLEHLGLKPPATCRPYGSRRAIERRRKQWSIALRMLAKTHREMLYDWLIGVREPPGAVFAEVLRRRRCMLDGLFRRARQDGTDLTVELEFADREIRAPSRLDRWAERYFESDSAAERVRDSVTKSHYRSAAEQADIWTRKSRFLGSEFDRVSARAARECGLAAGRTWDPELERHRECWRDELDRSDREREILSASAAPGLSRHHWGTEIDLFALDASAFRSGRVRHDEYRWMRRFAFRWGFYQSYGRNTRSYVNERWHWSYYPIAGAITRFVRNHEQQFRRHLAQLWGRIQRSHNREYPPSPLTFDYTRSHWKEFAFGVSPPPTSVP